MLSLADELPRLANEHHLTTRAIANAAGVSEGHLSRVRAKRKPASADLAERVARVFQLPPEYFVEVRLMRVVDAVHADPELRDRIFRQLQSSG